MVSVPCRGLGSFGPTFVPPPYIRVFCPFSASRPPYIGVGRALSFYTPKSGQFGVLCHPTLPIVFHPLSLYTLGRYLSSRSLPIARLPEPDKQRGRGGVFLSRPALPLVVSLQTNLGVHRCTGLVDDLVQQLRPASNEYRSDHAPHHRVDCQSGKQVDLEEPPQGCADHQ